MDNIFNNNISDIENYINNFLEEYSVEYKDRISSISETIKKEISKATINMCSHLIKSNRYALEKEEIEYRYSKYSTINGENNIKKMLDIYILKIKNEYKEIEAIKEDLNKKMILNSCIENIYTKRI